MIPFPGRAADEADETVLLDRARSGDRDALDALVGRYAGDVYGLALRILGDSDLAQDAAQDAFVSALGAVARFRGDASFRTWLLRIAANAARSIGRKRGRRRESPLPAADGVASPQRDAEETVIARMEGERVAKALEKLPEKQRIAVTLRTYQGLSYREIGQVAGCSEGSARVNYHLGVKRLRKLMT